MKRVLVLGAYGLIGAEVVRDLLARGHNVTGLGRDRATALRAFPDLAWHIKDLRDLTTPSAWQPLLQDVDAVVNCAGALQDGGADDLNAVHHDMLLALSQVAETRDIGIVQISAAGVSADASTAFFRSKAAGDAALLASGAPVWILRPGLVIAQQAYGGTALIRQLAAVPFVQPIAMGSAQIQTLAVTDLARVVHEALDGALPPGRAFDLVEETSHSLLKVVAAHRSWLGFAPAHLTIPMPRFLLPLVGKIADGLGQLGWRSPLRSSAIKVLADGVRGDPKPYAEFGEPLMGIAAILGALPAGAEHRLQARMGLLMPLMVLGLALFWMASGLIGMWSLTPASEVLIQVGWPKGLALVSVLFWAVVDIILGLAVMWRTWARPACLGMIAVSVIYLISASVVTPVLWLDPLGPLVKILPAILAALALHTMLERR